MNQTGQKWYLPMNNHQPTSTKPAEIARIEGLHDEVTPRLAALVQPVTTIGRDSECDIVVSRPFTSRRTHRLNVKNRITGYDI
jgi:pSer/pThr/pTyr-binding forkhead associated (FHA) protein